MGIMDDELKVFTVTEIARILHMSEDKTRDYLKKGLIPGNQVGDNWMVRKQALADYMSGFPDYQSE